MIIQILYPCEKCGELDAPVFERIAGNTVTTRLCPVCVTEWGRYVRGLNVFLALLEAEWAERTSQGILGAGRAIAEQLRYREELCRLALRWLGREEVS